MSNTLQSSGDPAGRDHLPSLLADYKIKINHLKKLEKFVEYFIVMCQLTVGIVGGITALLTFRQNYVWVYVINTISPSLILVSAIAQRVGTKVRRNIEKKNKKRRLMLECMLANSIKPEERFAHEIDMQKSIVELDDEYLVPDRLGKKRNCDFIDEPSAGLFESHPGGAGQGDRSGAQTSQSGYDGRGGWQTVVEGDNGRNN